MKIRLFTRIALLVMLLAGIFAVGAMAEGRITDMYPAGGITTYTIQPGDSLTLEAIVEYEGDLDIIYQWDKWNASDGSETISGADSTIYTTGPLYEYTEYTFFANNDGFSLYIYIDNNFYVSNDHYDVYVPYNGTATLQVEAGCDVGALTYTWYNENGAILDSNSYAYNTGAVIKNTYYECKVTDMYGNLEWVHFYVQIENHLTVSNDENRYVSPNESAELSVDASCDVGGLTFEWYGSNGHMIIGADGPTLTTDAITRTSYYQCIVRDQYGNYTWASFYIYIDNNLDVDYVGTHYVAPNTAVELSVDATCNSGDLTYQWYEYIFDEEGDYSASKEIEGATAPILISEPITEYSGYYCVVRDEYCNDYYAYFYILIENNLTINNLDNTVYVLYDETTEFYVDASCDVGELTYRWYKWKYDPANDYFNNRTLIDGATEPYLTTDAVTEYTYYSCVARDQYGNSDEAGFYAHVDNFFSVGYNGERFVPINETVELSVNASCTVGEITYQWYKREYIAQYDDYETVLIDGANGPIFTTNPITEYTYLFCRAIDQYYNKTDAYFNIYAIGTSSSISLNQAVTAVIKEPGVYPSFTFTPNTYGTYVLTSDTTEDTYGYLVNANGYELLHNDDGGTDNNFQLKYYLTAGYTYTFVVRYYNRSRTGSFPILLAKVGISGYEDELLLPDGITNIEDEAFAGTNMQAVIVPDSCTQIGSRAFADCPNLVFFSVPWNTDIAYDAFDGSWNVCLYYRASTSATPMPTDVPYYTTPTPSPDPTEVPYPYLTPSPEPTITPMPTAVPYYYATPEPTLVP